MDEIKDIGKKDHPALFDDSVIRTQPFGQNMSASRAYARAERITAAIHLVTSHISPDEPLRRLIRLDSLRLLSSILSLRDELRAAGSRSLPKTHVLIRKLISLLRILSAAGNISTQNLEALVSALDDLGVFLSNAQRSPLSEQIALSKEELLAPPYESPARFTSVRRVTKKRPHAIKDRSSPEQQMSNKSQKNHHRKEGILGVLGAQGQVGIKDIAASLPEYSEKMIQRELKSLVSEGKVKKAGAKRWSIYSLAQ